jgi:hypothetical protein
MAAVLDYWRSEGRDTFGRSPGFDQLSAGRVQTNIRYAAKPTRADSAKSFPIIANHCFGKRQINDVSSCNHSKRHNI